MAISESPSVLIVGAGPTGLAIALELGMRSIPCLIVERDERRGYAPRAKTTNVRTRELMRRWGIADELARSSPFGVDYPCDIHFVTRLSGPAVHRFENALYCSPKPDERFSEHGQWVPQYKLEDVMKRRVETLPTAQIQYGVEFLGFEQDEGKIRVRLRQDGREKIVEADYLIGADGARSTVRDAIGAQMMGTFGLSRNYNIIFRAPGLAEAHPHGPGIMYWQLNQDAPSTIGPMDVGDLWYFVPTGIGNDVTLTDEEAVALIKRSTGIDLPYEIMSSDVWIASRLLADRYRKGRAFLIGDACHLHPPWGGFGMNMGVADAVDLGWKIAASLQGWGGPALLDSYEIERRQVHKAVLEETERNHRVLPNQLCRAGLEEDSPEGEVLRQEVAELIRQSKTREFYALGVILGLRYADSPVIDGEADLPTAGDALEYQPCAAPGSIAPHAWLSEGLSLYDMFGDGFTLLVLDASHADDIAAAKEEATKLGVPLKIEVIDQPRLVALYEASLALIRPDQFVAWRGCRWPATGLLGKVTGRQSGGTN